MRYTEISFPALDLVMNPGWTISIGPQVWGALKNLRKKWRHLRTKSITPGASGLISEHCKK